MPQKETSNVIIGLRKKGWSDTEINDFLLYVETHTPTEEEARESKASAK